MTTIDSNTVVVDNTILTSVATCHTQAAMRYVLGLTTTTESVELVCGSAVHEALAWWLAGKTVDESLGRFDLVYRPWSKEHAVGDEPRAWGPVRRILERWFKTHPKEKWPFVVQPAEIEVPISAELAEIRGTRVVMVALLDAIGKMKTGGRWSIDHKTTGDTRERFERWQSVAAQFTGQLWLMQQNGIMTSGIYINAIELRKIPGSTRKCSEHGTTYEECGITHLSHKLFPVTRTQGEIDAWAIGARKLASKYLRLRERIQEVADVRELPMEGRFIYGACEKCPMRDWCDQGRPAGAAKTFLKDRWDPIAHSQKHVDNLAAALTS